MLLPRLLPLVAASVDLPGAAALVAATRAADQMPFSTVAPPPVASVSLATAFKTFE
jgi:hypothetical protein